jgi:hypothetical protein
LTNFQYREERPQRVFDVLPEINDFHFGLLQQPQLSHLLLDTQEFGELLCHTWGERPVTQQHLAETPVIHLQPPSERFHLEPFLTQKHPEVTCTFLIAVRHCRIPPTIGYKKGAHDPGALLLVACTLDGGIQPAHLVKQRRLELPGAR